jgi:Zn-finger nucleic acid-binding protein
MTPFAFPELAQQSIPGDEETKVIAPVPRQSAEPSDRQHLLFTDRNSGCLCPACGTETKFTVVAGVTVIACPACRGFLSQRREFNRIIERVRKDYRGPEKILALDHAQLHVARRCPTCEHAFETHAYAGPGTTVLDSCSTCETIWLDGGELERIEQAAGRRS